MQQPVRDAIAAGMPVYGTCAGLILLADRITDGIAGQETFGGLDVTVQRNAFGSQVDSFETDLEVPVLGDPAVHAVFIRAPLVVDVRCRASRPSPASMTDASSRCSREPARHVVPSRGHGRDIASTSVLPRDACRAQIPAWRSTGSRSCAA